MVSFDFTDTSFIERDDRMGFLITFPDAPGLSLEFGECSEETGGGISNWIGFGMSLGGEF